jgi:hypothetical protein
MPSPLLANPEHWQVQRRLACWTARTELIQSKHDSFCDLAIVLTVLFCYSRSVDKSVREDRDQLAVSAVGLSHAGILKHTTPYKKPSIKVAMKAVTPMSLDEDRKELKIFDLSFTWIRSSRERFEAILVPCCRPFPFRCQLRWCWESVAVKA